MVHSSDLNPRGRKLARALASLLALVLSLFTASVASSQSTIESSSAAQRIDRDYRLLDQAHQKNLTNAQIGGLWAEIASDQQDLGQFGKSEQAYNQAIRRFESDPALQANLAVTLNNLGTLYAMTQRAADSFNCRKQAFKILQRLGNPLEIARGEAQLADAYLVLGRNKDARQHSQVALQAFQQIKEASPQDIASALVGFSFSSCMSRHCADGLNAARRAMALIKDKYPSNSFAIGQVGVALGFAEWQTGNPAIAGADLSEALRVLRLNLPPGHPLLLQAADIYSRYLSQTHQFEEARKVAEEEKKMRRNSQAQCANCTVSIYGLRSY